jgi:hypothetical protein
MYFLTTHVKLYKKLKQSNHKPHNLFIENNLLLISTRDWFQNLPQIPKAMAAQVSSSLGYE